jgi:hypothetical protein
LVLENEYRFSLSVINQKPSLLTARCSGPTVEVLEIQIGIVHFYFAACINNNSVPKEDSKTLTKQLKSY